MKRNHQQWATVLCLATAAMPIAAVTPTTAAGPSEAASLSAAQQQDTQRSTAPITGAVRMNPTTIELIYADQQRATLDFYGENIFRLFQDPQGGIVRNPEAVPPAQILVDQPRKEVGQLQLTGFAYAPANVLLQKTGTLTAPKATVKADNIQA